MLREKSDRIVSSTSLQAPADPEQRPVTPPAPELNLEPDQSIEIIGPSAYVALEADDPKRGTVYP